MYGVRQLVRWPRRCTPPFRALLRIQGSCSPRRLETRIDSRPLPILVTVGLLTLSDSQPSPPRPMSAAWPAHYYVHQKFIHD
jgi:hypothetical protein